MTPTVDLAPGYAGPFELLPPDEIPSASRDTEIETERLIVEIRKARLESETPILDRSRHAAFILGGVGFEKPLPPPMVALDTSRTWVIFWALHSLVLLGQPIPDDLKQACIRTLRGFQNPSGGFGSGQGQLSHLAPTYSAVCSLAYLGPDAFAFVDRDAMYAFLLSMKQPDGSFCMHEHGEVDVRGSYCALTTALMLNILTPELCSGATAFIRRCQTYEGGIAASASAYGPQGEAHGGYTSCGLAAHLIASRCDPDPEPLDMPGLLLWAQLMQAEPANSGGFRGRHNKLVDGCYSWWCGDLFNLIDAPFNRRALQEYILIIAQDANGGLRDKPKKPADLYHTCYNLSGLSAAQYAFHHSDTSDLYEWATSWIPDKPYVIFSRDNLVPPVHPIANIELQHYTIMVNYFYKK